jgi:hypothetical protein
MFDTTIILIMTLLIMALLITLDLGDITYNDNTLTTEFTYK